MHSVSNLTFKICMYILGPKNSCKPMRKKTRGKLISENIKMDI